MAVETENKLPSLDVLVHKLHDGTIKTKVYKKNQHTQRNTNTSTPTIHTTWK